MSSTEDKHGDREWLAAKRRKPHARSLDPKLPGLHASRALEPASHLEPPEAIPHKHVKYYYLDGSSERVSARMLRCIELAHLEQRTKPEIMAILGIGRSTIYKALSTPKALRINQDMLARIKSGALLHAWSGLVELGRTGTKEDGVKLGSHNSVIDRLEGKPIQRSISISEHTETVRFIVNTSAPPAVEMVQDPVTGRYIAAPMKSGT